MRKRLVCFALLIVILCSFGLSTFALDINDFLSTEEMNFSTLIYYPTLERFDSFQYQGVETGKFEFYDKFIASPVYFLVGQFLTSLEYHQDGTITFTEFRSNGTSELLYTFPSNYLINLRLANLNFRFYFYAPGTDEYSYQKSFGASSDYLIIQSSLLNKYYYNQIRSDGHFEGYSEGYSEGFTDGQNSFVLPDDKSNGYFYAPIRTALSYVVGDDLADIMVIPILVFLMLVFFIFIFTLCRYRDKYYILRATCIAIIVLVTIYCIGTFGLPWVVGGAS